jgi:hypothetical protein
LGLEKVEHALRQCQVRCLARGFIEGQIGLEKMHVRVLTPWQVTSKRFDVSTKRRRHVSLEKCNVAICSFKPGRIAIHPLPPGQGE